MLEAGTELPLAPSITMQTLFDKHDSGVKEYIFVQGGSNGAIAKSPDQQYCQICTPGLPGLPLLHITFHLIDLET